MAILQTRIFVRHTEGNNWAENLMGRVIQPLTTEFSPSLRWFWFSRYVQGIGQPEEDRGDCNFEVISGAFKQTVAGFPGPTHRSLRFRIEIKDDMATQFRARLNELLQANFYAISDIRDYNETTDTGSNRHLGDENRNGNRNATRARLVTELYMAISRLVLDALVGPDENGQFRVESNDDKHQNPHGSTFETFHHLFCNITQVPTTVLMSSQAFGTHWSPPHPVVAEIPIQY